MDTFYYHTRLTNQNDDYTGAKSDEDVDDLDEDYDDKDDEDLEGDEEDTDEE